MPAVLSWFHTKRSPDPNRSRSAALRLRFFSSRPSSGSRLFGQSSTQRSTVGLTRPSPITSRLIFPRVDSTGSFCFQAIIDGRSFVSRLRPGGFDSLYRASSKRSRAMRLSTRPATWSRSSSTKATKSPRALVSTLYPMNYSGLSMLNKDTEAALLEIGRLAARVNAILDRLDGSAAKEERGEKLERYLTKAEAAQRLDVSTKTIDRLVKSGKLSRRTLGDQVRFAWSDIEALLK